MPEPAGDGAMGPSIGACWQIGSHRYQHLARSDAERKRWKRRRLIGRRGYNLVDGGGCRMMRQMHILESVGTSTPRSSQSKATTILASEILRRMRRTA